MALLLIIVGFMVLLAWKQGRPLKLALTPDEARKVREQWWFAAKCELKVWAILFVFGYALVGNALASNGTFTCSSSGARSCFSAGWQFGQQ